jgi:phosphatidylglycerophosphate synthase
VAISCALGATLLLEIPWLLGSVACVSFGVLLWRTRGDWTPQGGFGAANALTLLRLSLEVFMLSTLGQAPRLLLGALVATALALDGADGWLARRHGTSSSFGAHFDMEVDAFLVLTTSVLLWLSGRCGAWVLLAGALRYGYVLCGWRWPPRGGPMPRTLLGRSAFALVVVGHALGFALTGVAATLCVALGTLAVTLSFARSFAYGYRARSASLLDS